jgi:protein-S-isoprenylcysteine O-methyltransferase Ste14
MPNKLAALEWGVVQSLVAHALVSGAASTTMYWHLIAFAIVWGAGMLSILFYLLIHPALLRRRARSILAEPEPSQRLIVLLLVLCIAALFAVSLLDSFSGWSHVPGPVEVLGDLVVAGGLVVVLLAFLANPYAASTVTVEPEQTVISTGPYALVRNPMYSGGLLMFLGAPLGLGSWWGLVFFPPILLLIIWRLLDEERYLSAHLPGYREYCAKVTHHLIPSIW